MLRALTKIAEWVPRLWRRLSTKMMNLNQKWKGLELDLLSHLPVVSVRTLSNVIRFMAAFIL